MQVEVRIERDCAETRVIVVAERMDDAVRSLLDRIGAGGSAPLIGFSEGGATVLDPDSLIRVYAENGRVLAVTENGTYTLRGPLYDWERRLDPRRFVRISQSEIISIRQAKNFDLSLAGTLCVRLKDGTETFVSRRYVGKIKAILGL